MAFEKFEKTGRSYTPKLSIWKRGQFFLNKGAIERFELRKYGYVILYFDREDNRIGMKFTTNEKENGARGLLFRDDNAIFSAKSFLDYYDIRHLENKKYNIDYDSGNEMYVVSL